MDSTTQPDALQIAAQALRRWVVTVAANAFEPDATRIAVQAVRLYAEAHPRPPYVSQKQAVDMLGISPPTVKKMINSGLLKLNRLGQIPISQIDAMYRINGE